MKKSSQKLLNSISNSHACFKVRYSCHLSYLKLLNILPMFLISYPISSTSQGESLLSTSFAVEVQECRFCRWASQKHAPETSFRKRVLWRGQNYVKDILFSKAATWGSEQRISCSKGLVLATCAGGNGLGFLCRILAYNMDIVPGCPTRALLFVLLKNVDPF